MRVLFDGYWWRSGPAANRSVQRDLIMAWAEHHPEDQMVVAVRRRDVDAIDDLPPSAEIAVTRGWPHAVANAVELGRIAHRTRADVTVAHNYAPLAGRSIVFIHDVMFVDHPEWFSAAERRYFSAMLPLARRAAVRVTSTVTEAERILRCSGSGGRPVAVGLGVPTELTSAVPRPPAAVSGLEGWSVTVGRLNARKNLEAVITGVTTSGRTTPQTPLLVVGSSEHSGVAAHLPDEVRSLTDRGLVRFLGRVDDGELAHLYQQASLTVSLSRDEGFGLPPLEALHFGSPLLVSDIAVYRETVGSCASMVDPDASSEVIAAAVDRAWGRRPDAGAREVILERYSWAESVRRIRRAAERSGAAPSGTTGVGGGSGTTAGARPPSDRSAPSAPRLRVMQSYPALRPTTNPYIHQLDEALSMTEGIEHRRFDRREALLGRYDILHFHWPETLLGGRSVIKRAARRAYMSLLLARLAVTRTRIVRTAHNVELPSGLGAWERGLLRTVERRTDYRILLHRATPVPRPDRTLVIPHGHYVDWFGSVGHTQAVDRVLGFVGLVRRYKGVEHLIEVFAQVADPGLRLRISGNPTSTALAEEIRASAEKDPRVELDLRYLSEDDFARAVMNTQGVVLPYRFMHNSGSTLAALSLNRPVLVPRTEVNEDLSEEVGPGWVHLFDGDLEVDDLRRFAEASSTPPRQHPDLTARAWRSVGEQHLIAYRRAMEPSR